MTPADILRLRLENQRIACSTFTKPAQVVAWFGALQAQDYLGSLWAIGLRLQNAIEAEVEAAEAKRTIIRTWPMRGTLHFVTPADARWMLELLTPRVIARNAARLKREVDVDERVVARSREVVSRALEGGKRLARNALYEVLESARIKTARMRGLHILSWLAQDGTLCLAGRDGKQHTFALLQEWAPKARLLPRDAALAELARRYFTSHGPATTQDFMWWAGLTAKDAEAALDGAQRHLTREVFEDRAYWLPAEASDARGAGMPGVRLLPAYDEYTVAYKDRSLLLKARTTRAVSTGFGLLNPVIVIDGRVAGTWKRALAKGAVEIKVQAPGALSRPERMALAAEAQRYGQFLGLPVKGV